jgi:hypothetical protein
MRINAEHLGVAEIDDKKIPGGGVEGQAEEVRAGPVMVTCRKSRPLGAKTMSWPGVLTVPDVVNPNVVT